MPRQAGCADGDCVHRPRLTPRLRGCVDAKSVVQRRVTVMTLASAAATALCIVALAPTARGQWAAEPHQHQYGTMGCGNTTQATECFGQFDACIAGTQWTEAACTCHGLYWRCLLDSARCSPSEATTSEWQDRCSAVISGSCCTDASCFDVYGERPVIYVVCMAISILLTLVLTGQTMRAQFRLEDARQLSRIYAMDYARELSLMDHAYGATVEGYAKSTTGRSQLARQWLATGARAQAASSCCGCLWLSVALGICFAAACGSSTQGVTYIEANEIPQGPVPSHLDFTTGETAALVVVAILHVVVLYFAVEPTKGREQSVVAETPVKFLEQAGLAGTTMHLVCEYDCHRRATATTAHGRAAAPRGGRSLVRRRVVRLQLDMPPVEVNTDYDALIKAEADPMRDSVGTTVFVNVQTRFMPVTRRVALLLKDMVEDGVRAAYGAAYSDQAEYTERTSVHLEITDDKGARVPHGRFKVFATQAAASRHSRISWLFGTALCSCRSWRVLREYDAAHLDAGLVFEARAVNEDAALEEAALEEDAREAESAAGGDEAKPHAAASGDASKTQAARTPVYASAALEYEDGYGQDYNQWAQGAHEEQAHLRAQRDAAEKAAREEAVRRARDARIIDRAVAKFHPTLAAAVERQLRQQETARADFNLRVGKHPVLKFDPPAPEAVDDADVAVAMAADAGAGAGGDEEPGPEASATATADGGKEPAAAADE